MTALDSLPRPEPESDAAARLWCRDLVSCLQATFAALLLEAGHDPLETLGLHWEFRYLPGDVRSEEFYYPCSVPGDLAASLMPHHPISSRWHQAPMADPIRELVSSLPVIAAVDNFFLPFRPAYTDVHAAHLLILHDVDERAGTVRVSDAMPPAFTGTIALSDFVASWSSSNPSDEQDAFFSDSRIDRRYLTVSLDSGSLDSGSLDSGSLDQPFPVVDRDLVRIAIEHSLRLFRKPAGPDDVGLIGLAGLEEFLHRLLAGAAAGDENALAEAYPFGWGMQAQASLHGEFLRSWGLTENLPVVREAGRRVEGVAHAWSGVRICSAHGRADPAAAARELARHAAALRRAYHQAVDSLADVLDVLDRMAAL